MERNKYHLPDIAADMTPEELAGACTYIRSSTKNIFAHELYRRAGLLQKYQCAYTENEARKILDRAAASFGIKLI